MKRKHKVPFVVVLFCLVCCISVGAVGFFQSRDAAEQGIQRNLSFVASTQAKSLTQALGTLSLSLAGTARNPALHKAAWDLINVANLIDFTEVKAIYQDPAKDAAARAALTGAEHQKDLYSWSHTSVHASLFTVLESTVASDLYLVARDGLIVYSATKGENFLKFLDEIEDTPLAQIAAAALEAAPGAQLSSGFQPYESGWDTASMFLAEPLIDSRAIVNTDRPFAALVVRISTEALGAAISGVDASGMALDTQVFASDGLLLSDRPAVPGAVAMETRADNELARALQSGAVDFVRHDDPLTGAQFTAFAPVEIGDAPAFVTASLPTGRAMATMDRIRDRMLEVTVLVTVIIGAVMVLFARLLTKPIERLAHTVGLMTEGKLDIDIPGLDRRDEVADIARALALFRDNARRMRAMENEQATERRQAEEARAAEMAALARRFEDTVGQVVDALSTMIGDVRGRAESMTEVASTVRDQAVTMNRASDRSSANVDAVSTAAEELAAAVGEIGGRMTRAADMARQAAQEAKRGDSRVQQLAANTQKIGEVVTLIQDIAEQTNLLALNATIEAARAGEAGRGFAVVASEVKSLATQTARATEDIRQQIEEIQSSSTDAVQAIRSISEAIHALEAMATEISGAVEQQEATTQEIARNIQQAALGAGEISEGLVALSRTSETTGSNATDVLGICGHLSERSGSLKSEIVGFLRSVRAE